MYYFFFIYQFEPKHGQNDVRETLHPVDPADVLKIHVDLKSEAQIDWQSGFWLDVEIGLMLLSVWGEARKWLR